MADMDKEVIIIKKLLKSLNSNKITTDEIQSRLNMFCQRFMLGLNKYDERIEKIFNNYDIPQLNDVHTIFSLAFQTLDVNINNWDEDFSEVYDETIYPVYNAKKRKKNVISAFNNLSISSGNRDTDPRREPLAPEQRSCDSTASEKSELSVEFDSDSDSESSKLKCEYVYKKGANANKPCNVTTSYKSDKGPRCKKHSNS